MTNQELETYRNTLLSLSPYDVKQAVDGLYEDYAYFQGALQNLSVTDFSSMNEYYKEVQSLSTCIVDTSEKLAIAKEIVREGKKDGIFEGNKLHIEVCVPRADARRHVLEKRNYILSYDLELTQSTDNITLLKIYADAYNQTAALVSERGHRVKPNNIIVALQNTTGLKYTEDFEILNFNFNIEQDAEILDGEKDI